MSTDLRRPGTPSGGLAPPVLGYASTRCAPSGPRRQTTSWGTWTPNTSPPFGSNHLGRPVFRFERGSLWSREPDAASGCAAPGTGRRFEEVGPPLAAWLAAAMDVPRALVDERLERGSRSFAGWEAGELVCYGWVSTGSECIGELATRLR